MKENADCLDHSHMLSHTLNTGMEKERQVNPRARTDSLSTMEHEDEEIYDHDDFEEGIDDDSSDDDDDEDFKYTSVYEKSASVAYRPTLRSNVDQHRDVPFLLDEIRVQESPTAVPKVSNQVRPDEADLPHKHMLQETSQPEIIYPNAPEPPRLVPVLNENLQCEWEDEALQKILVKAQRGLVASRPWCRLFGGERFADADQAGSTKLPLCKRNRDGTALTVPSMHVKDMKHIGKSGPTFLSRKFYTKPLDLSDLFAGWRAIWRGNQYFLDPQSGADAASTALAYVLNRDDDSELVLPRDLLEEQLIPFVHRVNNSGGYACCEVGRAGVDWFSVRHLQFLGPEDGHGKAWVATSSEDLNAVKEEFERAKVIGKMFEPFNATKLKTPLRLKDYIPRTWQNEHFPDDPQQKMLQVACTELMQTILPDGGVQCSERDGTLLVPKPFYGMNLITHNRCPGCVSLTKNEHGSFQIGGHKTALSALGASRLGFEPPRYLRIEHDLQVSLKEILKKQLDNAHDMITLHCTTTDEKKGSFPIIKATPILRICDRWYNPFTLEPYVLDDYPTVPMNLTFLDASLVGGGMIVNDAIDVEWRDDVLQEIMTDILKSQNRGRKWCQLFSGARFMDADQAESTKLPLCVRSENGKTVTIPSMHVKDLHGIEMGNQRSGRTFYTQPVDLSGVFAGWKATWKDSRYFLDCKAGADTAGTALASVVNHDDDSELVLPRALLEDQLIPFVLALNQQGGYACCEVGRVGDDWFTVRNLQLLGQKEGHVEFQVYPPDGGGAYENEFVTARTIGATNKGHMFEEYEAVALTEPLKVRDLIPEKWRDGSFPDKPDEEKLAVPCIELSETILPNGGVHCTERHGTLLVPKPLYGVTLKTRSHHPGCGSLERDESSPPFVQGYPTALSALGASHLETSPPPYIRLEEVLQRSIEQIVKKQWEEASDVITLHFTKTAETRAGLPILKATPILRVWDRWYNPYTLEPYLINELYSISTPLTYLDVSVEQLIEPSTIPNHEDFHPVPRIVGHQPELVSVSSDVSESVVHEGLGITVTEQVEVAATNPSETISSMTTGAKSSTTSNRSGQIPHNVPHQQEIVSQTTSSGTRSGTASRQSAQGLEAVSRPTDRKVVSRSMTRRPDGTTVEKISYSDGTSSTVTKASRQSRDSRDSTSASKSIQSSQQRRDLGSHILSSLAGSNVKHVVQSSGANAQGGKRVKARTSKTASDGTRVEVTEYTDGTKVTKRYPTIMDA